MTYHQSIDNKRFVIQWQMELQHTLHLSSISISMIPKEAKLICRFGKKFSEADQASGI